MAKKQTLGPLPAAELLTDYKLARLAGEWSRLEDERLQLQAEARNRGDRQGEIEREFKGQLEALGKDRIDLPKYEIGFELKRGSPYYRGKVRELLGEEEFDRFLASVEPKRELFVRVKQAPPKTKPPAPKRAARRSA